MTKTKVTPIIRMVFLFWLVVSIALVGTTIAMLPSPPDRRHEHEKRESGLTVDIDFNSFDSAGPLLEPPLSLKDLQRPQFGTRVASL